MHAYCLRQTYQMQNVLSYVALSVWIRCNCINIEKEKNIGSSDRVKAWRSGTGFLAT
jgi:hypothetical protein